MATEIVFLIVPTVALGTLLGFLLKNHDMVRVERFVRVILILSFIILVALEIFKRVWQDLESLVPYVGLAMLAQTCAAGLFFLLAPAILVRSLGR